MPAYPAGFGDAATTAAALPSGLWSVSFRYALPLVASTVSWEGARLRPGYSLSVRG